jgi:ParB-like chromosome segregation protein Spo0J
MTPSPINRLRPLPSKPNEDDIRAATQNLLKFGQQQPVIVTKDGRIIAGNNIWLAAKRLGWHTINVNRLH